MTNQEIFDKVAPALLAQGERSMGQSPSSHPNYPFEDILYHGSNGYRCAIGFLIPEEYYSSKIEGEDIPFLFHEGFLPFLRPDSDNLKEQMRFLEDLQRIHDQAHPSQWFLALESLAIKWELSYDTLEPFRGDLPLQMGL